MWVVTPHGVTWCLQTDKPISDILMINSDRGSCEFLLNWSDVSVMNKGRVYHLYRREKGSNVTWEQLNSRPAHRHTHARWLRHKHEQSSVSFVSVLHSLWNKRPLIISSPFIPPSLHPSPSCGCFVSTDDSAPPRDSQGTTTCVWGKISNLWILIFSQESEMMLEQIFKQALRNNFYLNGPASKTRTSFTITLFWFSYSLRCFHES